MKNLILNAFAFKKDYQTSMQMGGKADEALIEVYMKNIFVSLKSAKLQNPKDDVMLVTNCKIPEGYENLFEKQGILLTIIPFENFVMPKEFVWSLAYFKLCALQYVSTELSYEKYLLLDADTITIHSYGELWEEAAHGLMLYPVGHAYRHKDRELIRGDSRLLYPENKQNVVHYGGEFICGNRRSVTEFVKCCRQVYNTICEQSFPISKQAGDETILSLAAMHMPVIGGEAYIYRYWTDEFYLVSTNTVANPVVIWHIPNEKKDGFLELYAYYEKHGAFPPVHKSAAILGICRAKRPFNYYTIRKKIIGKIRSIREQA